MSSPDSALRFLGSLADSKSGLLLLETVIDSTFDDYSEQIETAESNQAIHRGSRPNPIYVLNLIKANFKYAYVSLSQPNHADFQLNVNSVNNKTGRNRMIFIGSNKRLTNPNLSTEIPQQFEISH